MVLLKPVRPRKTGHGGLPDSPHSGLFLFPRHMAAILATLVVAGLACQATGALLPSSTPTNTPRPNPPKVNSAWSAVLSQIHDDGTVSSETALQAFAVAFGPLPGVTVPPGDTGAIPSGTAALRWLVAYWRQLTREQRKAAIALVPELVGLEAKSSAGSPGFAQIAESPIAGPTPPSSRSDADYTKLAQSLADEIGSKLSPSRPLGIRIEGHRGPTIHFAHTSVLTSSGGFSGTPDKCVVVDPAQDKLQDTDYVGSVLAHEVWQCFEGAIMGLAWYWSVNPGWIEEGEVEWVGDSLFTTASASSIFWPPYLNDPSVPLFKRSYDAVGFYTQLASSGVDVWSKLIPIMHAKANAAAFQAASADSDPFLDRWAAGYLRDGSSGDPWDITESGATSDHPLPTNVHLPNGAFVADRPGDARLSCVDYANRDGISRRSNG